MTDTATTATAQMDELDAFIKESVAPQPFTPVGENPKRHTEKRKHRRRPPANRYTIQNAEQSVLLSEIDTEERPYSQLELSKNRSNLWSDLNLSRVSISHSRCNHSYYVKFNGKKFKDAKDQNSTIDVGNCSVCWKLRKTPRYLSNRSRSLVEHYMNVLAFQQANKNYLTFEDSQIEKIFYVWLYLECYEDNFRIK